VDKKRSKGALLLPSGPAGAKNFVSAPSCYPRRSRLALAMERWEICESLTHCCLADSNWVRVGLAWNGRGSERWLDKEMAAIGEGGHLILRCVVAYIFTGVP